MIRVRVKSSQHAMRLWRRFSLHTDRTLSSLSRYLRIDSAVEAALKNGEPVVALESTIVAHGMPYPKNLETAQSVEFIIRSKVCT
jgi:pseudouridine-5'-phosphate glycosidase